MREQAAQLLRQMLGPSARFHPGQWEAIKAVAEDRSRILVVQRTGWGKSLVYLIATRLLRKRGGGPTLLVSPLLALMRNQVEMAQRAGVRALSITSENEAGWNGIERTLQRDDCDLLLVSPERLRNERFVTSTLPAIRRGIGLFVVDEAHCISDWGHDFRPDYRRITRIVGNLPPTVPVLATTATANDRVVADIAEQLGHRPAHRRQRKLPWWIPVRQTASSVPELVVQRGPLTRPSLRIQVLQLDDQAERLAWLARHLPVLPGAGIVYCLTIADCERVSEWLRRHGINAPAYHGELGAGRRAELEQQLIRNDVKALVATVALGMGFDKPDLGFVVHYQRPGSVVAYYQQIGRAGRAVDDAYALLMNGREDDEIHDYFIRTAFPGAGPMRQIVAAVEAENGLTTVQLEAHVNLGRRRIEQCLTLLEVAGAIRREGDVYSRTINPWTPDEDRWQQVTARRYAELQQMQTFVTLQGCLMEFLARALDDPTAGPCGRCASCTSPPLSTDIDPAEIQAAIAFLRHDARTIEPRRQWPGARAFAWSGMQLNPRNAEGRILCVYGDAGWGQMVKDGKYRDGRFNDHLVAAAASLIRERWTPHPTPAWVAAVPSLRHPSLVPDFARRLAALLGLPFQPALTTLRETPEQKLMENSAQQLENIARAFSVITENVSSGPALLVDDIVDSRWTLTFCGALLRAAGSGIVYPFALAGATSRL